MQANTTIQPTIGAGRFPRHGEWCLRRLRLIVWPLGRRSDRACRSHRDLRAAVGLAGRHLHAARRADGRRRPHVRMVGAARLVALMLFLAGIAINLVLGCCPPRISCEQRRAQPGPDGDGPSHPAQAGPGSPAALISA